MPLGSSGAKVGYQLVSSLILQVLEQNIEPQAEASIYVHDVKCLMLIVNSAQSR